METQKADRLAQLNGYQIAGLALLASTVASLGVVYVLRRVGIVRGRPAQFGEPGEESVMLAEEFAPPA